MLCQKKKNKVKRKVNVYMQTENLCSGHQIKFCRLCIHQFFSMAQQEHATVMILKFLDRQAWANSVDPDQTAARGAI